MEKNIVLSYIVIENRNKKNLLLMFKISFFVFLFLLLTSLQVWGQGYYYEKRKGSTGKVGLFDRKSGEYILPPLFDKLGYWDSTTKVGYCVYEGKYYLININGELVVSEGLDSPPYISKYFVIVKNHERKEYVVDYTGHRISPYFDVISSMDLVFRVDNAVFYARRNGNTTEDAELLGIDFKPISSQKFTKVSSAIFFPAFIFKRTHEGEYGMFNLDGEVLIKPEWDDLEVEKVHSYLSKKWLKNKKLSARYTKDELEDVTFMFAYRNIGSEQFCAIFSTNGQQITPPLKSGSVNKIYGRAFKRYLLPYLLEKERNLSEIENKINAPFQRYQKKLKLALDSLPLMGGTGISLVDWIKQREQNKREQISKTQEKLSKKEIISSPENRQVVSSSGGDSNQRNNVPLPVYGELPESFDICYRNAKGTMEIRLTGSRNSFNGFYTVTARNLFGTFFSAYSKVEDLGDRFKFGEPVRAGVTGIILSNTYCTVSKDWKEVHFSSLRNDVYNEPIDTRTFDCHVKNIDKISRENSLFNYNANTQQIMDQHRQNIKKIMNDSDDTSKNSNFNKNEKQNRKPRYIDKKIYGPRYVDVKEWCEQCQEWDYPHEHGKIRVD